MRILVGLGLMLYSALMWANDSAFGGSGALPVPISEQKVLMQSERIRILGDAINTPNMQGRWIYQCRFDFKNLTNQSLDLKMGFPFPVEHEWGEVARPKGHHFKKHAPLVYGFIVLKNGKRIASYRANIGIDAARDLHYRQAFLWNMRFEPLQKIRLIHHYYTGVTQDVMGYDWVHYVLRTGALWANQKIGRAIIEVIPNTPTRLCYEIDKKVYLKPKLKGLKIIQYGKLRRYLWQLNQFKPQHDMNLCLMTGSSFVLHRYLYPILQHDFKQLRLHRPLSRYQIRLLINTLYARHGRSFVNPSIQRHFNRQWWYKKNKRYSDKLLTQEDKHALKILTLLEKRAP